MSGRHRVLVPGARAGLEQFRLEVSREIGINPEEVHNDDPSIVKNCIVGGQMVRRMIEAYENKLK